MVLALTIAIVSFVAGLFWAVVPLDRLFDAFQPMTVALSIIIAAIFVRLNRGMPTLEWKSLEASKRSELTAKIVELSKEYVTIVAINVVAIITLVTLIVIGKDNAKLISSPYQHVISGIVGALFSLCLARMAYVVWRDVDIMTLQKYLIDNLAERDAKSSETDAADKKIATMRAAAQRGPPMSPTKEL